MRDAPRRVDAAPRRLEHVAAPSQALLIVTMHHRRVVLQDALTRAGWQVVVYDDVSRALTHVREQPYAAIFCDEYLRGASAGGFLAWSRRLHPKAPFYVIATHGDTAAFGARQAPDRVLPFPPADEQVPRPAHASRWDGAPAALRDLPLEGSTALVRLADLVEMLALTEADAVITLDEGRLGRLYLAGGQLEHATCADGEADLVGVRALGRLLDADEASFQVLPYRSPSRRTVHTSTAAALTEASRVIDEQRRDRRLLEAVRAACPDVLGVAAGYLLNESPAETTGDGATAFAHGVALLNATKAAAPGLTHLGVEAERHAHALVVYGADHLLAAHGPRGRSMVLLSALAKAVKQHGR
jgi:hypothetical protein